MLEVKSLQGRSLTRQEAFGVFFFARRRLPRASWERPGGEKQNSEGLLARLGALLEQLGLQHKNLAIMEREARETRERGALQAKLEQREHQEEQAQERQHHEEQDGESGSSGQSIATASL